MSDSPLETVAVSVAAFSVMVTTVATLVMVLLARWDAARQEKTVDDLRVVAKDTHTLVNSNMGAQLSLNAVVTRRLATITRDPADAEAATLAERLLKEHSAGDRAVNRSKTENPQH